MEAMDYDIIEHIKSHDDEGIKQLLKQYGGLMKNIMQKHLYQQQHYIDECMNDTLLAIWNNIEQYDETKSSFKNWVAVISKYQSIDMLRRHVKETREQAFSAEPGYQDHGLTLWEMEWHDMIRELPEHDQQLLHMIYVDGYKPEEAARLTGRKTSNVYNKVSRLKKKLRENGGYHQ